MKKTLLALVMTFAVLVQGCSSGVSQEEYNNVVEERDKYKELYESAIAETQKNEISDETIDDVIDKQSELQETSDYNKKINVKEYSYMNILNDTVYCMVVKNNSDKVLKFEANVIAKDKKGKPVGAGTLSENAIEPGYSVAVYRQFDGKGIKNFEYDLDVEEEEYYNPVISNIELKTNKADKKIIVSCTNKGETDARFVEATALFFKKGKLININDTFCVDKSSKLSVGKTITKEIDAYKEFDDVKVYLSGYE